MKILTAEQIKEGDAYTIKHEPISSIDLINRVANLCFKEFSSADLRRRYFVFCGNGNNGADGLSLFQRLSNANAYYLNKEKYSNEFTTLLNELNETSLEKPQILTKETLDKITFATNDIIVDALYGVGLNKKIDGLEAELIRKINASGCKVVSIDMPSGLFCDDNSSNDFSTVIKATHTLTFQQPKLAILLPKSGSYCGQIHVLDIGIHPDYLAKVPTTYFYIDKNLVNLFYKKREKVSHKGTYGNALLICGNYGMMGAAVLSTKACIHAGAGLVTAHIPKCGYQIMQTAVPETMCSIDENDTHITTLPKTEKYNAVAMGCGIGNEKQTQNVIKLLIQNANAPLVLDADALNIIAENKTWLSFLPAGTILTPHPKEFERLFGKTENDESCLALQIEMSKKHNIYIVYKTAHTRISCPDGTVFFNSTGNPGMATAGSGDVLTGIITSLLAQNYTPKQACILGVYLHGLAGDFAAQKKSEEYITATDIVHHLSLAFKSLKHEH